MNTATVFPASMAVHCPSGIVYTCDDHGNKLLYIMNAMGFHVMHEAAPEGAMCSNCINESSHHKATGETA